VVSGCEQVAGNSYDVRIAPTLCCGTLGLLLAFVFLRIMTIKQLEVFCACIFVDFPEKKVIVLQKFVYDPGFAQKKLATQKRHFVPLSNHPFCGMALFLIFFFPFIYNYIFFIHECLADTLNRVSIFWQCMSTLCC
jgi:hypothetical protein